MSKTYIDGACQRILTSCLCDALWIIPAGIFVDEETQNAWMKHSFALMRKRGGRIEDNKEDIKYFLKRNLSRAAITRINRRCALRGVSDPLIQDPFINRVRRWNLNPTQFKYDRAVGVEIECVKPANTDVELPIWARAKTDGSIRTQGKGDAVEYNLLLKRSLLEVRLYRFCEAIRSHSVNQSCGLHIHLDCRDKTYDEVLKIAKRMDSWLSALKEFLPESRRDNSYCKFGISRSDRYRAVNFVAYDKYQTLEVRVHSGSIDYTKIIAWIRLLELLFSYNAKVKGGATGIAALSQLPMAEYERSYWIKRHQVLNPRQYNSSSPTTESE